MSIKLRYFASLKDLLGRDGDEIAAEGITTVADAWTTANPDRPLPGNILAAVNMDYASLDGPVKDGDELGFFPPVTGG
ncbi:MAG: molybdopterin synthase sulfur carrier subunit [Methylobacter sp.]|nr:MAG: molybdopterin synthase sulfur carrier subunit [Methylobacter sp.]